MIPNSADIEPEPARTAFAHYGVLPGCRRYAGLAREQILRWVDEIRALDGADREEREARLFDRLMQVDPLYGRGRFDELPADLQARERHFLGNTLDGVDGFLRATSENC